jgi:hypothetical protein
MYPAAPILIDDGLSAGAAEIAREHRVDVERLARIAAFDPKPIRFRARRT